MEFCHVVGLNILYDVTNFNEFIVATPPMACSSIVTEDSKGAILHGRNLDYMMQGLMKNISILVDFTQNHKVVYSSVTFAFFAGITTGQRPNAFTLSLNARSVYCKTEPPFIFALKTS
ncbi:unnamed protein product [Anisakis simplex]|uniref:Choloylglycine hydrolase/NAAA C-terminal domain-containing protein n=1 Tax=Anisakis simplex TaxID=6269 RepID=A0A3P6S7W7_ANISI|nr:unnamed protein product [Anisakis simplex]